MEKIRVIILGAAGRDFHNFNTYFRDNEKYDVVAFTATQIPNIDGRKYPAALAGSLYPDGIPIYPEAQLADLIHAHDIDQVVFAYSDVPHEYVMHKAVHCQRVGGRFRAVGWQEHDAREYEARDCCVCCPHGMREVADDAPRL